ncbi:cation-translocating P-type ATPase [Flavobacterium sp. Fl-77]|uniref:Cation-translocating P-type ATPase n=1 Tax=Flavobacterium flavipigmentatum TaxID=2893884 RepID=A0AAJ2SB53_9FLAO|nr:MULTISPECIES: cation-translocating P-type ATPase [unclassified Flavobacterium]MDX6182043.1 cation-translocating P-type ATPase [Flavobacterium sp. Fl-33]MDX6186902.1 cation-translocating P-type ATPase [Flavobacterium sp. Fl-77]UFH37036.1 cation-translocating P-type ATPase [Flavobacterium sp. F-70]
MTEKKFNTDGLTTTQVLAARKKYGPNISSYKKTNRYTTAIIRMIKEPMMILLLIASSIYFISGKTADGFFLTSAIILISAISSYQNARSHNALEQLKDLTKPKCKVIRNGLDIEIKTEEIVMGDSLLVEEGVLISADGIIEHSNDFSVNESILTGESMALSKDKSTKDNAIYQGTTVASGLAIATVIAIGSATKLGKIGKSLEAIKEEKTPLEMQIGNFVKKMAIAGTVVFLMVWAINYFHSFKIFDSLLKALTLAMSILPEEIPIAFTTFMAIGAWRMMKEGIIVKQMKTVETLGSATVICIDKTGTITQNQMSLAKIFSLKSKKITTLDEPLSEDEKKLITLSMWASEPIPFDPMEIALHEAYTKIIQEDERPNYKLVHEYPLSGKPPMMTHLFENKSGTTIIAAKGGAEALMNIAPLSKEEKEEIAKAIEELSLQGYRILAVGESHHSGNYPKTQQEFTFDFIGLLAFYDPPKKNIKLVLEHFYKAGIEVKIITGDNALTTSSIAKEIDFKGYNKSISGDELMKLSDKELKKRVKEINLFTRMFPEAKLKIINALKSNKEIVAMTGDGVNDGPALKASHIGIAMGKKGTEIAKQAASLILINDDLSKMVHAIAMGRKIYANIKKSVQFIISIHIPIIFTVFIPLALGWIYPNIFSPIHIIFLELVMGPTCSIVYENEPMEKNTMTQKPRPFTSTFFSWKELSTSIIQGIIITIGTLFVYQYCIYLGYNEKSTRTMVFVVLVSANIFLTLMNRSFYYSIFTTLRYKNNLVPIIIAITVFITGLLLYIKPFAEFFAFEPLKALPLSMAIGVGFVSVMWYELVKLWKRNTKVSS